MKRRVVVTGVGALTPIGNSASDTWESAKAGVCGIAPISFYDTADRRVKLAAEIKNYDVDAQFDRKDAKRMARFTKLAKIAAEEAVRQSGIDFSTENTERCGTLISSGIGGLDVIEAEEQKGLEKGFDRVSPFFIPMCISNMAAGETAIKYGLRGLCSCTVTACAGGTNAIGDGFRNIRDGYQDVMICGGCEACITPLAIGGFTSMRALCESEDTNRASIPFDLERSGFVLGEGAGILLMEEYEHARARGAEILFEICGYGASCDAFHITSPCEDGSGAANCMRWALEDAGIQPEQIDYINAHGTSTKMNDLCETHAIHSVFGEHAANLAVSSTKSMTGHLLGAAGAVEAILCGFALKDGFIPATINYRVPDPECDLDCPKEAVETKVDVALSNSLGFGGHNAVLIFKAFAE